MATIELTAGSIEYQDTGGSGPVVVLLHGLAMNDSLWRYVVSELGADHRCVIPTCRWAATGSPCAPTPTFHPAASRLEAEFLEAHACARDLG